MNIQDKDTLHECTSCQVCAAVCPRQAISIDLNKDGFYRPQIDMEKCVDCGACRKVCYKYADVPPYDASMATHYAAYVKDEQVVRETTSGGIADLLCRQLVSEGYTCVGVAYDYERNVAVGSMASTEEDTRKFRGSKYIQSYSYPAFRQLLEKDREGKYAVFGTPCQIYALDRYLTQHKRRGQFVLIDIYCHGCPSMSVWSKYVGDIQRKSGFARFDHLNFRSKVRGWGNFYVVVVVVGGKPVYVSPRTNDRFYAMFFSDAVLNDACYDCKLRSTLEHCDIRLGDFWGKQYDLNNKGVSVVSVASERGVAVFDAIRPAIWHKRHEASDFLPYQSYGKSYAVDEELRSRLLSLLADKDVSLDEVVKMYWHSLSWKKRLKNSVRNLVLLMPQGVISVVKRLYH